jgi:hypothetical protein
MQASVDELGGVLGEGAKEECLERNVRLAELLVASGRHKKALGKYRLARE